jgi:hypothetical protein
MISHLFKYAENPIQPDGEPNHFVAKRFFDMGYRPAVKFDTNIVANDVLSGQPSLSIKTYTAIKDGRYIGHVTIERNEGYLLPADGKITFYESDQEPRSLTVVAFVSQRHPHLSRQPYSVLAMIYVTRHYLWPCAEG